MLALTMSLGTAWGLGGSRWWQEVPRGDVILALPISLEQVKTNWDAAPDARLVSDEILKRPAIQFTGNGLSGLVSDQPVAGEFEVTVLVRMPSRTNGNCSVMLMGGLKKRTAGYLESDGFVQLSEAWYPDYRCYLVASAGLGNYYAANTIAADALLGDSTVARLAPVYFYDRFPNISPVMDEDLRLELEAAMAGVPEMDQVWCILRIVSTKESLRMFKDGLLVGERRPGVRMEGFIRLTGYGPIRVAALTVRKIAPQPRGYYPVPLDGACNARDGGSAASTVARDALPPAGSMALVDDIPFVFPDSVTGQNTIDIGAAIFHWRNRKGSFDALTTWMPPGSLETGRVAFDIPNRAYTRLWVVAAADENPLKVPVVTVRFYRPYAGFPIDAAARIPALTGKSDGQGAQRLPVTLAGGKKGNLWLVPIELDGQRIASEFREEHFLSVELTKEVYPFRSYPDPCDYSYFPGGLPSSVKIYALTFEEAPLRMLASGNRIGNVYVRPEEPIWQVKLANQQSREIPLRVKLAVTDPYGRSLTFERAAKLAGNARSTIEFPLTTRVFGLHKVRTEVRIEGGPTYVNDGSVVEVAADTRLAHAGNSRWGLWCWGGGHGTIPDIDANNYLLRAAGSRFGAGRYADRQKWGMAGRPHIAVSVQPWAYKEPYDPAEYAKYSEEVGHQVAAAMTNDPDTVCFCQFGENAISMRMTYGIWPRFLGEPDFQVTEDERKEILARTVTAKAAAEGIRKYAPTAKISFSYADPMFVIPFLEQKYPKENIDYFGIDVPTFERMPEMPVRAVTANRMWLMKEELKRLGYDKVPIIHTESYYPSSHPLGLGARIAADYWIRTAVLSLALGSTRLANCFGLEDCSGYWGNQHYGCIGAIGRRPEFNPKPVFPAYATMTRLLDLVEFDGFVPCGSLSAYCVRFRNQNPADKDRPWIYCLWTLRGTRPAAVQFAQSGKSVRVDESGNEFNLTLSNNTAQVTLAQTPFWITSDQVISNVTLGVPVYTEKPGPYTKVLAKLDQLWTYDAGVHVAYASNHWDMLRVPGPVKAQIVESSERQAKVWQVTLGTPEHERPLAAWYSVYQPPQPIAIPGKARALGVWANGNSDWSRIVYEIADAKGEVWLSVGTKDDWNCDDNHQWSFFNFDGWRYVEFPLPNHKPGDNYREQDTVWWGSTAEGVVDLPVKLTRVIIEQRTHNIYVDALLPVSNRWVQLSDLMAVYDNPEMMTDAPVKLQQAAVKVMPAQAAPGAGLANPIATLKDMGVGAPAEIAKLAPPPHGYDGTRINVTLNPVAGAKEYRVYVSAYASGAGAKVLAKGSTPEIAMTGLRADFPLYLFITYLDDKNAESKPSAGKRILLRDDFPMK
jgi:hypothetical protein